MSKRSKRFEIEDLEPAPEEALPAESQAPEIPKIPFTHWFDKLLKTGKVKHYQDEAILVFFKKRGLKSEEPESKYNSAFEKF